MVPDIPRKALFVMFYVRYDVMGFCSDSRNDVTIIAANASKFLESLACADRPYGRFKFCASAFHECSLDASSLAADLAAMLDLPVSEAQKDTQAAYLNSLQDEETGFYHEAFVSELDNRATPRIIEMSGTYFGFQVAGALEALGRLPHHPFVFYEFTLKPGAITRYLEERFPWERSPWGAGGWVDSVATMLRMNVRMGHDEYSLPLEEMMAWLGARQDPQTGLWGKITSPQGITGLVNGGYHLLRGTFFKERRDISWPERMIDSCIAMYHENNYFRPCSGEGCHDLDLFDLIVELSCNHTDHRHYEVEDLCNERLLQIVSFANGDGGFGFFPHKAQTEHNYYKVSPGLEESDVQGTLFYLHVIRRISECLSFDFNVKRSVSHGY